jgi:hypothetical protein
MVAGLKRDAAKCPHLVTPREADILRHELRLPLTDGTWSNNRDSILEETQT